MLAFRLIDGDLTVVVVLIIDGDLTVVVVLTTSSSRGKY